MRIPFPERVAYSHALIFASVLAGVQLAEHSNPVMVGLVFCFILVAATAFNIAGGMYYASGTFIGCNAVMTLLLPMVAKTFLGEAADKNLRTPVKTVEIYLCGAIVMCLAAVATRYFRPKNALISDKLPPKDVRSAYRGCVLFSYLIVVIIGLTSSIGGGSGNGSLGSLLYQIDKFPLLAYVLGVISAITVSQGRRSLTYPLIALMLYGASEGLVSFSKEAFLLPFFCWAFTASFMRYRISWVNVICFAGGLYLTVSYMIPYAQTGKGQLDSGRSTQEISGYLLTHMDEVRAAYAEQNAEETSLIHDYDRPINLLDRLDILAVDDALVDVTDRSGFFGYTPIIYALYNSIPHLLWPSKPRAFFGNTYGHEVGLLASEDFLTSISFSFAPDGYHQGGIFCLFFVLAPILVLVFLVLDSVIGDTRRNPVGLLMTIFIFRVASEGATTGLINLIQQPLAAVIIVSYTATHILPVFGSLLNRFGHNEGLESNQVVASL